MSAGFADDEFTLDELLEMIRRLGLVDDDGEPDVDAYLEWMDGGG